ncbi:hypothetical protein LCGC14_0851820 [marine sediment metagenome]|uniref:Right handed beta helix domain-containing protein n=1 Tax=marine sediment metagenome TaxID=412755 RepID=A0A0F9P9Y1_9ZZZZ
MALNLLGVPQIFSHSRTVDTGVGNVRIGQATFIVALDDSGDFDSIQEAIDALPSTGGVVYIKEGTYDILTEIIINKSNVSLFGAGKSTIIRGASGLSEIIDITDVDYISIRDLSFGWSGTTGTRPLEAIDMENSTGTFIESCWIGSGIHGSAIVLTGTCTGTTIRNLNIDGDGTHPQLGITLVGDDSLVQNCYINDAQTGIKTPVGGTYSRNRIIGCIIRSCSSSGLGLIGFYDGAIIGNCIDACSQDAISMTNCDRNTITGNNLINSTQGLGTGYGIDIDATSDRNIICGNLIYNNQDGAVNDGGSNTHPNGTSGTTNLALDDLNIIA